MTADQESKKANWFKPVKSDLSKREIDKLKREIKLAPEQVKIDSMVDEETMKSVFNS